MHLSDLAKPQGGAPPTGNSVRARDARVYLGLIAATVVVGLASRRLDEYLPGVLQKNTGDALWAVMAFWLCAALLRRSPTAAVAAATGVFCLGIELLKLAQAPWLDAARNAPLGRLVFGYTFSWSNLACYAVGIACAAVLDARLSSPRPKMT